MVDKKFCMSSYLAFRYIEKDDKEFTVGLHHEYYGSNVPLFRRNGYRQSGAMIP